MFVDKLHCVVKILLQAKEIADLQSKIDESSGKIHSLQSQVIKLQVSRVLHTHIQNINAF